MVIGMKRRGRNHDYLTKIFFASLKYLRKKQYQINESMQLLYRIHLVAYS